VSGDVDGLVATGALGVEDSAHRALWIRADSPLLADDGLALRGCIEGGAQVLASDGGAAVGAAAVALTRRRAVRIQRAAACGRQNERQRAACPLSLC
jgi:hypothetical protein